MTLPRLNEVIKLPDGRRLAYAEYGDGNGKVIFLFHGLPGSRLSWGLLPGDPIPSGLRIIAPDRPGCGCSDSKPHRTLLDWAEDVEQLADALGIARFAVVGVSGGGPGALACAWKMPHRLTSVGIVSGPSPTDAAGVFAGMSKTNRFFIKLAWRQPWLSALNVRLLASVIRRNPARYINAMKLKVHDVDRRIVSRPEIQEMLIRDFAEALRAGAEGMVDDMAANHGRPWGFPLGEIKVKVHFWVCELDRSVPPAMGRYLGNIVPNSEVTTGKPKGVLIPPPADDPYVDHPLAPILGAVFGFSDETVYLSPAPLYHAAPLNYNMMVLSLGGTTVVMEKFEPEAALALIQEHRCTHSQWVPIMFIRMLKLPRETREQGDVSSMQFAIHAAAPCPIEVKEQMIEWWGPVIVEYYAASEAIGFTIIDSAAWLTHKGSVGPAVLGQIHIVDDDGNELAAGEIGTVYFSGEQASFQYHGEPEKTAEAFDHRGWATTGDVGYVDEDGFLYLTDRKHFTIISGGVNIYPQEIENILITHGKVADVAVFGVPDEEFGETVTAVVQPLNWADATDEVAIELMEWLRDRVAHLKVPKALHWHPKLPRMDNGKLYKRHLAEEFRGGARADDGPRVKPESVAQNDHERK